MSKVYITKEQENAVEKILQVASEQGVEEGEAKGKALETHIKKGWDGTEIACLSELKVNELAQVLFGEYEIKKEKIKYQEYEVEFRVDRFTKIINTVIKRNDYELTEEKVIDFAMGNVNNLGANVNVDQDSVTRCETIKIEKE